MPINQSEWIFKGGRWVPWAEATLHVSAHALHYGSAAFEGIRAYRQHDGGTAIFRLGPHVQRLLDTCRILRMPMQWNKQELEQLCIEAVARNRLASCYIRPIIFRDVGGLGLNPLACPTELAIFAIEWGRYLGEEGIEHGVDAMVSSWRRFNASTAAPLGKICGQYTTSQFVSIEARDGGFAEGIMLDQNGNVTEGSGENIFWVRGGEITTPPLASSILGGITRDSVLVLAKDLGLPVRFEPISRDMLYVADELFMCGTAAEITPVRSVDRIEIGTGSRGPITEALQERFFAIVEGRGGDPHDWLTPVPKFEPEPARL